MSILGRFKLTGKRLFITGSSRGLGREMAVAIADAGADVILVGRDQLSLEKTAGDIRALAVARIHLDHSPPQQVLDAMRADSTDIIE